MRFFSYLLYVSLLQHEVQIQKFFYGLEELRDVEKMLSENRICLTVLWWFNGFYRQNVLLWEFKSFQNGFGVQQKISFSTHWVPFFGCLVGFWKFLCDFEQEDTQKCFFGLKKTKIFKIMLWSAKVIRISSEKTFKFDFSLF